MTCLPMPDSNKPMRCARYLTCVLCNSKHDLLSMHVYDLHRSSEDSLEYTHTRFVLNFSISCAQDDWYFCQAATMKMACAVGPLNPRNEAAALVSLLREAAELGQLRKKIVHAAQQFGNEAGTGDAQGLNATGSEEMGAWFREQGGTTRLAAAVFSGLRGVAATTEITAGAFAHSQEAGKYFVPHRRAWRRKSVVKVSGDVMVHGVHWIISTCLIVAVKLISPCFIVFEIRLNVH